MAVMELWRRRDLEGTVKPEYIDGNFFTQDSVGNLVGVKCYKDGAEVALTGSVTGYCVLPSGETVSVAGTRSGNQASILVPQSALAYTGPLGITLKLIDGNTITTLMRIIVVVYRSKTDTVITPSSQIITDWANQISAALQEVEDASAAQDVKIAGLESAIGNIKEIYEKCGREDIIPQQYGQSSVVLYGGGTGTYDNWFSTDYMPCVPGECYHFGAWGFYNGTIDICPVSFFDSNKRYIDGISSADLPTYQSANNRLYDDIVFIPPNAAYYKQAYLSVGGVDNFTKKLVLVGTQSIIAMLNSILTWRAIDITADKTDIPLYGGGTSTYSNWYSTDYIDCSNSIKLDIVSWGYFANGVNICPISFYNASREYLSSISGEEGTVIEGSNRIFRGQIDIPGNAKYFRLASYKGAGSSGYDISASEYVYNAAQGESSFISRLKIVCIGDSLTEGDQGADPYASAQNITPFNYPYWMQKYLGCRVVNKGKSGYTTMQSWNNVVQSIDFTDVNTVIIMLGSNGGLTDTIETDCPDGASYSDYANTNTGCYCKIIEYCMAQTSGTAQIILCTPPHIGKVRGQKRTTTIAAAEVVRKIASRYCLPLIDMMAESGFSDYNEDVYQPVDGLHFSVDGYKRMGTFIGSRVKSNNAVQITL